VILGLLTEGARRLHTRDVLLQLAFKSVPTLAQLQEGQEGVLEGLDAPEEVARRLMELGFLPGSTVTAARSAPGGDPRIFRVDGSEIALRLETAAQIRLRRPAGA
jgi:ferrous iron transport protein A